MRKNQLVILKRISERKGHNGAIYQLLAADDNSFYSVAGDGWLVNWSMDDPDTGRLVAKVESGQLFSALNLPDRALILAGALDGGLHWLYPKQPERNKHLRHHSKGIFSIVRVGNDLVFCGGGDGILSCWSLETGRVVESWPIAAAPIRRLYYLASQNILLVASSDQHIHLIDTNSFTPKQHIHAHENSVFCLAIDTLGRLLSSGRDAKLKRWSFDKNGLFDRPEKSIAAHNATVNDMAFSPDGKYLATASRDKTLRLWDSESLELLKVAEPIRDHGHVNSVNTLLWIGNNQLISAGDDRRILTWELDQ